MVNRKTIGFLFCTVPFAAIAAGYPRMLKAKANSAPPYWQGVDASGLVCRGEQCSVVVEKEVLTLNIPHFPKVVPAEAEAFSYDAKVKADYTFYNPEEYDVSMTLLFPYGELPDYADGKEEAQNSIVTLNDEATACSVRYTYNADRGFEMEGEIKRISEEKRTGSFYREDMKVTPYTCHVTLPHRSFAGKLYFIFDFNPQKSKIIFADEHRTRVTSCFSNGYSKAEYSFCDKDEGKQTICFYGVGEPVSVRDVVLLDEAGAVQIGAYAAVSGEPVSFEEFALKDRDETCGVSETDYYNAFVDMLDCRSAPVSITSGDRLDEKDLMRWYEYELEIVAGGRVNNCVTAPIYPTIEGKTPRYEYSYLLSPAQKWADFKSIEIVIETPYQLTRSSLDFIEQNAEGTRRYTFSRNSLPQGELTFVLAESGDAGENYGPFGNGILASRLTVVLVSLSVIAIIAATVTAVIVMSMSKKKKK